MNILVVGAGPAGCYSAYLLAKQGHTVAIIEEHEQVGLPVQCTGIVTSTIENILRIPLYAVKTKVDTARIFSPSDKYVEAKMIPNLILDRASFDNFLAEKAQIAGAQLYLSHRFVSKTETGVEVKDIKNNLVRNFCPDVIIGADGPNSTVAKVFGMFDESNPRKFFFGSQAIVQMEEENIVNFYPTPEGIAWTVPEGNNLFRVGVAVHSNPNKALSDFIAKRCPNKQILGYQGGLIPVYDPSFNIQKGNIYLVGDAAGQVKATTAGGIIQGLIASQCLATSIATGKSYQKLVNKALGKELWLHLKIRDAMDRFNDTDYNSLIEYTNSPKIKEILATHNRDDLFSFFFKMLWHEPKYLGFVKTLFRIKKKEQENTPENNTNEKKSEQIQQEQNIPTTFESNTVTKEISVEQKIPVSIPTKEQSDQNSA